MFVLRYDDSFFVHDREFPSREELLNHPYALESIDFFLDDLDWIYLGSWGNYYSPIYVDDFDDGIYFDFDRPLEYKYISNFDKPGANMLSLHKRKLRRTGYVLQSHCKNETQDIPQVSSAELPPKSKPSRKCLPKHIARALQKGKERARARQRDVKLMSGYRLHSAGAEDGGIRSFFDSSAIEDLFILVTGICTSTSVTSASMHILAYVKTHYRDRAIVSHIMSFVASFFETANDLDHDYVMRPLEDDLSTQVGVPETVEEDEDQNDPLLMPGFEQHSGGDFMTKIIRSFKMAKDNWDAFKTSSLFRHIMYVVSLVATLGFLPSHIECGKLSVDTFKTFGVRALDFQRDSGSLLESLMNTVYFFVTRGYALITGNGEFITEGDLDALDKEYSYLVGAESLIASGKLHLLDDNKIPGIESQYEYDIRIKKLISRFEALRKVEQSTYLKKIFDDKLLKLHKIMFEVLRCQKNTHFRESPYSFALSGSSSIGKSTLNSILITAIAKHNDIPCTDDHKCVVNEQDKYDTEFQAHTTIVTLDDFGNMKPDKVLEAPTRRIIDLINNVAKTAVKADVSEKGAIMINPKIVTITTNTGDLHASYFSSEPVAIMRRLKCIIVPELRASHKDEFGGLDSAKFIANRDAWTFSVFRVKIELVEQGSQMYRVPDKYSLVTLQKGINIFQLVDFVKADSAGHFAIQKQIVEAYRRDVNVTCCKCSYPRMICSCVDVSEFDIQAYEAEETKRNYFFPYTNANHWKICTGLKMYMFFLNIQLWYLKFLYNNYGPRSAAKSFVYHFQTAKIRSKLLLASACDNASTKLKQVFLKKWETKAILALGATTVSAYLMYRAYRKSFSFLDVEPQGNVESDEAPEKVNVWKKPTFIELPRSLNSVGITHEQLFEKLSRSIGILTVKEPYACCNIVPLKKNYWLAPKHVFKEDKSYDIEISFFSRGTLAPVYAGQVNPKLWRKLEKDDFIVLQVPFAGDQVDLFKYLAEKPYVRDGMACDLIYRDHRSTDKELSRKEVKVISDVCNMYIENNLYKGCIYRTSFETFSGMCMGTLISKTHSPAILGFHLAGKSVQGVMVLADKAKIQQCMNELATNGFDIHSSGTMDLDLYGIDIGFRKVVHPKSPVNFMLEKSGTQPSLALYGSHSLGRTNYNSRVKTTFISEAVTRIMGKPRKHGPPPLLNLKVYWHQDLDNICHDTVRIDMDAFSWAHQDLITYLKNVEKSLDFKEIRPLSWDEACAGIDGRYAVDSIDLTTSMGFPINKPKKYFLTPSDRVVEGITRPLDIPEDLAAHIQQCEERYAIGERCYPILKTTMKDEPTKIGKLKRRLFQASPCWYILVMRKYFLTIGAFIQKHNLLYCTAVGANAHGDDWHNIANHLQQFGSNKYIAGDYKAFDKHMPAIVVRAAAQVFIEMARMSSNYTGRDLYIMQGIITDLIYPILEYDGALFRLVSSHCSGNSLTVLINNFVNLIYMRMAYFHVYKGSGLVPPPFSSRVNILVYGDDNVAEIHTDERLFHHTSCALAFARMGIEYTMADKDAESVPYIPFSEISFLKRKFYYEPDLLRYVAPLEEDSIFKSLHCMMVKKTMELSEREIVAGNIHAAFLEMWMHGKNYYDHYAPLLYEVVKEFDLQVLVGDYAPFESHIMNYKFKYMSDDISDFGYDSPCTDYEFELHSDRSALVHVHSYGGLPIGLIDRPSDSAALVSALRYYQEYSITFNPNNNECLCTTRSILHSEATTIVWPGNVNPQEFELHSGREEFMPVETSVQREVVSYSAMSPGYNAMVDSGPMESTFNTVSEQDSSLADFLSRPVLIRELTLPVGASLEGFTNNIRPWQLFLLSPPVLRKTANFRLLRGKLKLRFEINASPFQAGKIMVTYDAFEEFYPDNILRATLDGGASRVIPSQRMKIFLNPASSTGAEMTLPFFYKQEFIDLSASLPGFDMGVIRFWSLSPFKATNGTTTPLYIKVYASMEDVVLAMPSFFPQAYEGGAISKPATAVAAAARMLSNIPYIGNYMKATEYAAGAVAKMASLFGYSKPTNINAENRVVRHNLGNMACATDTDSAQKLAIDAKNELTVDPRVVGLAGKDELAIANIAGIESYLWTFPWVNQQSGDLLASFQVTPMHYAVTGGETTAYFFTASCVAGSAFKYWKGSQKFRFIISSTNFNRGRLKIVWEPTSANLTTNPLLNTNFTHIVDLAETNDFTICVGWGAPTMFLECATPSPVPVYDSVGALAVEPAFNNGKLWVYVLNPLSSSTDDLPSVDISVFTSMCDDVEFANPTLTIANGFTPFLQSFTLQSATDPTQGGMTSEEPYDPGELIQMSDDCMMDKANLVYFGEKVLSIRTLFKRYCRVTTESVNAGNGTTNTYIRVIRWLFLGLPGPDTKGMHVSTAGRYNYTNWSYISWFKVCYAGWRGALRYKICWQFSAGAGAGVAAYSMSRTDDIVNNIVTVGGQNSANSFASRQTNAGLSRGAQIADSRTRPYFDVEFPFMYNQRIRPGGRTSQLATNDENFVIAGRCPPNNTDSTVNITFDIYTAGGEDFSLFYWMGPPVLYPVSLPVPVQTNPYPVIP